MKVIYKYEIKLGLNKFKLPFGSKILSIQNQDNKIMIWCLQNKDVDNEHPQDININRYFIPIGTGWDIEKTIYQFKLPIVIDIEYLSTVQQDNLVWHIFEIITLEK